MLTYKDGTVQGPLQLAQARVEKSGYPFKATGYREADGEKYVTFLCPLLQEDGRCGDYKNRPGTCRNFEPASEGLCVYFKKIDQAEHEFDGEGLS